MTYWKRNFLLQSNKLRNRNNRAYNGNRVVRNVVKNLPLEYGKLEGTAPYGRLLLVPVEGWWPSDPTPLPPGNR